MTTDDLVNPRAFKHRAHPLERHTAAFAAATGCDEDVWQLRDRVWRSLVIRHLLPEVSSIIQLSEGSYNSAYARYVDGLTNNEASIESAEIVVPAGAVEEAFASQMAVPARVQPEPAGVQALFATTITAGLSALVDRRVEVVFLGAVEPLNGKLVAVHPDSLVLAANETITVVPLVAVAYLATWQLTEDEDQISFD